MRERRYEPTKKTMCIVEYLSLIANVMEWVIYRCGARMKMETPLMEIGGD